MNYQPIKTAPKVLHGYICAWRSNWDRPRILQYKTNSRFSGTEHAGVEYYGDPDESDDYCMCFDELQQPTHWLPVEPLPETRKIREIEQFMYITCVNWNSLAELLNGINEDYEIEFITRPKSSKVSSKLTFPMMHWKDGIQVNKCSSCTGVVVEALIKIEPHTDGG